LLSYDEGTCSRTISSLYCIGVPPTEPYVVEYVIGLFALDLIMILPLWIVVVVFPVIAAPLYVGETAPSVQPNVTVRLLEVDAACVIRA
jgi:hypothetical protein